MVVSNIHVNKAATLRIVIKKGMIMELEGVVIKHVGNMIGVKASATGKVYHLFHYDHTQGTNVYEGSLYAGKKRLTMKARLA